jgi:RNA polymerase-binding transcription factor DksA
MTKNIAIYEKQLIQEKAGILTELAGAGATVGGENGKQQWEPKVADVDSVRSDSSDVADRLETYEENAALVRRLTGRLKEVDTALANMRSDDGKTFGICRVCSKEIEEERLAANPAATTCIEHVNSR